MFQKADDQWLFRTKNGRRALIVRGHKRTFGGDGGLITTYLLKLNDFLNLKLVKFAVYKYLNKVDFKNKVI